MISLLEGIATTRAIRRYTNDPIPDEDLATIMFAASRAPSGSNRQPFRFLVLRDGPKAIEAKRLLGNAFRAGWAAKVASDGYEEGTGRDDSSPKARMARTMQHYVDHFEEIPVVVLACLVRYRDVHYTEGASIYPACQNLLLAARALGYGGALTGWHAFVETELRDAAGHPGGRRSERDDHARAARRAPRPGSAPADPRAGLRRHVGRRRRVGDRPARCPLHLCWPAEAAVDLGVSRRGQVGSTPARTPARDARTRS